MNAPTEVAGNPTIDMLPPGMLKPSTTHIQELRRKRFDPKLIDELAESIKAVGILQPILVRPLELVQQGSGTGPRAGVPTKCEIVAGERRWLAAKKAGLELVPTSIRTLTDEQVLEVQLIENLQREGLHELEEAEGYEELMKLKKISADVVGEMVGKSRSYVFARTKLLALCPEARKAFYGAEIDFSKALLIARIGHHDTQREALKVLAKGRFQGDGPMSYREAHKYILENFMLRLKAAPFDINDANLVAKAGTCPKCPKRAGNQEDLFGDVKDKDTCTDPKCFDDKRQAHYAVARRKLEEQGKKIIYGDAAKKLFPDWDSENGWARDRLQGAYQKLSDTTYVAGGGRKVSEVLGADFEPTLVQHPGTGEIIKAASQQAIAAAAQKSKRAGKSKSRSSPISPREKPEDRTDDIVGERVLKAVYEKAPTQLGVGELRILAAFLWSEVANICVQDRQRQLGAALGWTVKPSYSARPPKELAKLAPKDLSRLCVAALIAIDLEGNLDGGGDAAQLYKATKVDPKKIEKDVRAELKKKAEEEKAAAKVKGKAKSKKK